MCYLCSNNLLFSQSDSTRSDSLIKLQYKKALQSKDLIMGSLSYSWYKPGFILSDNRLDSWNAVTYQNQWLEIGYGFGNALQQNYQTKDTIKGSELKIGLNIPFKKITFGKRLYDISGILIVPSINVHYSKVTLGNHYTSGGIKFGPQISLQLPYIGFDFKYNFDLKRKNINIPIKGFSMYPEFSIKVDGLYNLLDPVSVFTGHYKGERQWQTTDTRTNTYREGDFIVTETTKITTTHHEKYDFDQYTKSVGPFVAIGPHYTFSNHEYSGNTSMIGLGYYLRAGYLSSDLLLDFGKIGFASKAKHAQTLTDPNPKRDDNTIDKKDFTLRGTYDSKRITARIGLELVELLTRAYYKKVSEGSIATKFTRIQGGFGFGYATIENPRYDNPKGRTLADSIFNNDYTLLSTSRNHAAFGQNTPFTTWFISIEVGAVRLSFENYRYKNAFLANTSSVSIGYLLPYNRLIKKYKAIKHMRDYIKR